MSEIKLTTLTPVHVGSGNLLQYNTDFITTATSSEQFIRIIDERKILNLIGVERINDWVLCIERKEPTKEFVKRYAPQSKPTEYSKRKIVNFAGDKFDSRTTLKECIHNGFGCPYIPGSSIKGSIRTAILSALSNRIANIQTKTKNDRNKVSAQKIEEEFFGKSANDNFLRFIQVGDAYFETGCEVALKLVMYLNITTKDSLSTNGEKPQIVEAIGVEEESTFQLKINTDYYKYAKSKSEGKDINTMPEEIQTLETLFQLINNHTRKLVMEEIDFWSDEWKNDSCGSSYIEKMEEILSCIDQCNEEKTSCVLRIGHASGWRFITGAWSERFEDFSSEIVNATRPGNIQKYSEYPFPKSRRTDKDGDLMGFVKLSMV